MHTQSILIFLGLACLGVTVEAATIGPIVNPNNGHSYYVEDAFNTWADAQANAQALGGNLVTINDASENAWILANLLTSSATYWIGLSDADVEGTFVWKTGEPLLFSNWAPGEPDDDFAVGGSGDYVFMNGSTGEWLDTNGSFAGFVSGSIIEVAAVPVPAAGWLFGTGLAGLAGRGWLRRKCRR